MQIWYPHLKRQNYSLLCLPFQILSTLAFGLTAGDFAARDLLKNREYNSAHDSRVAALRSRIEMDDSAAAGSAQVFRDEFPRERRSSAQRRNSYLPRGGRSEPGQQQQRMRLRRRPQSRQSQVIDCVRAIYGLQICQTNRRIGCVIPRCKLQCWITQPILLF